MGHVGYSRFMRYDGQQGEVIMMIIERLNISPEDRQALLDEVNNNPFIGQMSAKDMARLEAQKTIIFLYQDNHLLGFAAWEVINARWCEVGPFYVLDAYRQHGLGKDILQRVLDVTANYQQYIVTKNPIVKKAIVAFGFRQVSFWRLPWAIKFHLLRRLTPTRLLNLIRKFDLEPAVHYIRTSP